MGLIRINRSPSRRQLNVFGIIWLAFFSLIGWMVFQHGQPRLARVLWIVALSLPIVGWVFPAFMRWLYVGMAYAALPIGLVVSHVILAAVYYLLVTPLGWAKRLVGYDPMERKFDDPAPTYWVPRDSRIGIERYFRQF